MNVNIQKFIDYCYEIVTFDLFLIFFILYFFIIWVSVLLWVIRDIFNRTTNVYIQALSISIILFLTPLGIFIYLLIRPWKTLFEKYYNEIEENLDMFNKTVEERSKRYEVNNKCSDCGEVINSDFKFCPKCKSNIKKECKKCSRILLPEWKICPYCWVKQKK